MSTPAGPISNVRMEKPSAKYKCPVCETEDFNLICLNTVVPLKYSAGNQVGEISTLRSIVSCGSCRSVISIQYIPVELPAPPPPDPKRILV